MGHKTRDHNTTKMKLQGIQRRRVKGYKLPPNTRCVNRGTKWGNPFVVGRDGTRDECIRLFELLCNGLYCVTTKASFKDQERLLNAVKNDLHEIRGLNLACFCEVGDPCHRDILLKIANK